MAPRVGAQAAAYLSGCWPAPSRRALAFNELLHGCVAAAMHTVAALQPVSVGAGLRVAAAKLWLSGLPGCSPLYASIQSWADGATCQGPVISQWGILSANAHVAQFLWVKFAVLCWRAACLTVSASRSRGGPVVQVWSLCECVIVVVALFRSGAFGDVFRGMWDGVHPVAVKRFKGTLLEGRFDVSNELEVLKLCRCAGLPIACPHLCANMQLWQVTLRTPLDSAGHLCGAVYYEGNHCYVVGLRSCMYQVALPDSVQGKDALSKGRRQHAK